MPLSIIQPTGFRSAHRRQTRKKRRRCSSARRAEAMLSTVAPADSVFATTHVDSGRLGCGQAMTQHSNVTPSSVLFTRVNSFKRSSSVIGVFGKGPWARMPVIEKRGGRAAKPRRADSQVFDGSSNIHAATSVRCVLRAQETRDPRSFEWHSEAQGFNFQSNLPRRRFNAVGGDEGGRKKRTRLACCFPRLAGNRSRMMHGPWMLSGVNTCWDGMQRDTACGTLDACAPSKHRRFNAVRRDEGGVGVAAMINTGIPWHVPLNSSRLRARGAFLSAIPP